MKFTLVFFVMACTLFASDFSDDFESFNPGDDIASSVSWLNIASEGEFIVAEEGTNNVVEVNWGEFNYIAYASDGNFTEGTVSADFKVSGSNAIIGLFARADILDGAYSGGIAPISSIIGMSFIVYSPLSGDPIVLQQDLIALDADTWYSVDFEVTGLNPVSLVVSIDGQVASQHQDNTYNLEFGFNGVTCGYNDSEPTFFFDNYVVDDYDMVLEAVSFGGIKALFR